MPVNHTQCVERAIEALAGKQFGAVSRRQAVGLGATRRMLDYRVKHGAWPLVLRGVYRISVARG